MTSITSIDAMSISFMTASPMGLNIGTLLTDGCPMQPVPSSGYTKPTHGEHETTNELQCSPGGGTGF